MAETRARARIRGQMARTMASTVKPGWTTG